MRPLSSPLDRLLRKGSTQLVASSSTTSFARIRVLAVEPLE